MKTIASETSWIPTPEDRANLETLRVALGNGSQAPIDLDIVSYALKVAAASLTLSAAPAMLLPDPSKAPAEDPALIQPDPGSVLIAHTDGACSGNPGPGGWGVILGSPDGKVIGEFSGGVSATTNNRMELTAVREALRHAPTGVALEITTDSKNVIGWLSGGWKRNDPAIAAICREIDPLMAARKVTFKWVKGHAGDPLNERVDKLAVAAIGKA